MPGKISFLSIAGVAFAALTAATVAAQQPTSGSQDQTGPYSVTSSIEIGVRGVSIEGNADKYRSDLNYQPGVRLFDSSFLFKSNGGSHGPIDTLLINSSGWGGDPNGYARLNAEKLGWYRFDVNLRQFDYFNSLNNLALNQHISNNDHKLGDFDLTLLPQNDRIKFNIGYSFDRSNGLGLTTYDYARDEFPVFSPVRVAGDEYRFGVDATVGGVNLSFQQGLRYFKEDTSYEIETPQPGNNPTNTSRLATFRRDIPTRGTVPHTVLNVHTLLAKKIDITGRFVYQSARTRYTLFETITGTDASNNTIVSDTFTITGDTKRPNTMGDLGVTFFVTDKLRVSDSVKVNAFHIDGGLRLMEALFRTRQSGGGTVTVPPVFLDELSFRDTRYRVASNTIEIDYDFHRRFSAHFGHRYTDRRIELHALDLDAGAPLPAPEDPETFDNRANSYIVGFKARPLDIWTVYFSLETGEADNVFTRTANYDFTNVKARSRLAPTKTLTINLSVVTKDNRNPALFDVATAQRFGADINTRTFTASADWSPSNKFWLSSGYTHSHVTSDADIIFFANSVRNIGLSRYFLRDNFAFLNTQVELHPRASLYASYRINHDRGQGDRVSAPTVLIDSYPQQFQTPEFRLAVKLHNRMDWNVGYQYFDFKERFLNRQFYQAHLPYTSLRFYFNKRD
jgi:hypothetical protein